MNAQHVRLGSEPVVHSVASGGWTTCGIMYGEPPSSLHKSALMSGTPTEDPVDCMTCLVQEVRGSTDTIRVRGTIMLSVPVHVVTFIIETEPKK